nr:ATP-binding cassette domain-containing protein [Selenomonas ruminantium]
MKVDKSKILIQAEKLGKEFRSPKGQLLACALQDVDIILRSGEMTALIGPDGAGKTTFMRLVAGLLTPDHGSLKVLGGEITGREQEVQALISYMPQKFGLYEDLTVAENLDLYADLHGVTGEMRSRRFPELLAMTGLAPFQERLAGRLSGGMKQKLGLACTLVRSPEILLLDEPTVGVDPLSRRELWRILKQLSEKESLSVLVSTAYMDEAELCHNVYVLNRGRVLAAGTPQNLSQQAAGRCYFLPGSQDTVTRIVQGQLLDDTEHVIDAVPAAGGVRFIASDGATAEYFAAAYGQSVRKMEARLEDAFMLLLHQDRQETLPRLHTGRKWQEQLSLSGQVDIEVKELVRQFGDFTAVDKTSFQVHRGEVFGLLGPNGAGKTTTFRMLCGLLSLTNGFLSVAGVNLRTARTRARGNIGYVAQKFSLYGDLTVKENLSFFGGVYGLDKGRLGLRMEEVLTEFGLAGYENMAAKDLPGGYEQRLAMAAALLHEPQILFLDEPTSGIDPLARRSFWQKIAELSLQGKTIVITTHFMEEAEYCDRFMIQDQGRLIAIGTPAEIRQRYGDEDMSMNEIFIRIVEREREHHGH